MERKDYEKFANQKGCYMLHDEDRGRHNYKIGYTHNIVKRFEDYNSGMDFLGFIPSDNITKDEWDKDVHRYLKNDCKMEQDKGHHKMNDREWYVFSGGKRDDKKFINLCNVISYALKSGTTPDYERTDTYAPRAYQREAINKCIRFFQNNPSEKYFLFAMKCRSGKSFTALMTAKELGAKDILVLTYKPNDVKKEWKSLVNNHVAFKDINFKFCSFQRDRKLEECVKKSWDVIIVDEDHFGADKEKARNRIAEFNTKYIFLLTGTPAYQIMYGGFTEESSYSFTYVDEQEYIKTHSDLVALSLKMYAAHIGKVPGLENYSCGMSEFLRVKDSKFVHEADVKLLMQLLIKLTKSFNEKPHALRGFIEKQELNHIMFKLPSCVAVSAMAKLLREIGAYDEFGIIQVTGTAVEGLDNYVRIDSEDSIESKIDSFRGVKRTISLTVVKGTVGVTIEKLDSIFFLDGSDSSTAVDSYIQALYRPGTPCNGKKKYVVLDFSFDRVLSMPEYEIALKEKTTNKDHVEATRDVLNYMSLFDCDEAGEPKIIDAVEFDKKYAMTASENIWCNKCVELLPANCSFKGGKSKKEIDLDSEKSGLGKAEKAPLETTLSSSNSKKDDKKAREAMFARMKFIAKCCYIYESNFISKDMLKIIREHKKDFLDNLKVAKLETSESQLDEILLVLDNKEFRNTFDHFIKRCYCGRTIKELFKNENLKNMTIPEALVKKMTVRVKPGEKVLENYCNQGEITKFNIEHREVNPSDCYCACYSRLNYLLTKENLKDYPEVHIVEIDKEVPFQGMKFDKVIMNPPYDKNLHLKILSQVIKENPDAEIINLSPVRWLQDPLAERKKNSDWNKFEDVRKHISDLEVIPAVSAQQLFFGARIQTDLGIYLICSNTSDFVFKKDQILIKILNKLDGFKYVFDKNQYAGWRIRTCMITGGFSLDSMGKQNLNYQKLFIFKDGFKNGKPWYDYYSTNQYSKKTIEITNSIKFNSELEAKTFIRLQRTKLAFYIYNKINTDVNVCSEMFLHVPECNLSWTDEDLYKYFNLTEEEITEVEDFYQKHKEKIEKIKKEGY